MRDLICDRIVRLVPKHGIPLHVFFMTQQMQLAIETTEYFDSRSPNKYLTDHEEQAIRQLMFTLSDERLLIMYNEYLCDEYR